MVKFLDNEKSWTVAGDLENEERCTVSVYTQRHQGKWLTNPEPGRAHQDTHTFSMSRDLGSTHTLTAMSIPNTQISVSKYHSPGKETSAPGRVLTLDIKYMTHKRKI